MKAGLTFAELPELRVLLAAPRGFCAGVRRAIDAVRDAIAHHGAPVYVRRPIVHNLAVVRRLEAEGAIFVRELDEVPTGAVVILSAHGVARGVQEDARRRNLRVYDAICPLVAKVHRQVERYEREGRQIVLVGHEGHPEIEGTLGQLGNGAAAIVLSSADVDELDLDDRAPTAVSIQTTFSVEDAATVISALRRRFPDLAQPASSDICYATTNRQASARDIARVADATIVVGESFSSNACRLVEVARDHCRSVQLVADARDLDWSLLPERGGTVGITAAASTPNESIEDVVEEMRARYRLRVCEAEPVEEIGAFKRVAIG